MSDDFDFDGAGNGPILKVGEEKEIGHGLKKKLVKEGEGSDTPEVGDEVQVHYTGRLVDGTTFYSSKDIGIPFDYTVGEDALINGLNRSLLTMKNGEVASFTIPPQYGFGSTQIQHVLAPIPPRSTLCYEVELLSLVKVKKPCDMNTEERIEAAGKKKGEGNDLLNAGQYARASKRYEKARKFLEYDTDFGEEEKKSAKALKVVCNLNDAACKLKLKEYKEAEKLCTQVLELESSNVKAHFIRAQAYILFAEVDIEKALEIDPNNMEVKLEYKTLKEKVKETNKEDAKLYGNMFTKRKKLDSLDSIIDLTKKLLNNIHTRSRSRGLCLCRLRFPVWRGLLLRLRTKPVQTSLSELVHSIVPLLLLKLEKSLSTQLLPDLKGFLLEQLQSSLLAELTPKLQTNLSSQLVPKLLDSLETKLQKSLYSQLSSQHESFLLEQLRPSSPLVSNLATILRSDLQHPLLDSLKPKLEESLYSRLLSSLTNALASQLAPVQKSPPPTPSPIPSADNHVRDKNSEESKENSLVLNLSEFSLRLFGCMIPFIAFVHDKANAVESDPKLQTTVLLMALLVHTGCVFSFDGLWSTSSATETLLGRCWFMMALNACISTGASVLISVFAGKVCRAFYIAAFCGEWVACMVAFVARRRAR